MATAISQGATGNAYIDGVLSGVKWSGTVTYSFPDSASDYPASGYSANEEQLNDFRQISVQQQQAVHWIMQQIVNYTNLTITFAGTDSADIRLAHSDDPGTAWAYYPGSGSGGDVWFGDNYNYINPVVGNYEYLTHIHEIGHAFGLKHSQESGGPANIAVPADRDALEYTVMSYRSYLNGPTTGYTNEQWGYPTTFMMNDIAALQTMYGADFTYNSGNTVYKWTPGSGVTFIDGVASDAPGGNRIFLTIWDGGGVDTYDFSSYSTSVTIDLGPGDYSVGSSVQLAYLGGGNYAHGNVYNAYLFQGDVRSYIENAIGGSGNDFIYGNDIANDIRGGAGNDYIEGGDGNDFLYGNIGIDTIYGGAGDDFLQGNEDNDILYGGPGNDDVRGGKGNDLVQGNEGNDIMTAGLGDDDVRGGKGDDSLDGGAGVDILTGGLGNDVFIFNIGEANGDTITDFAGNGAGLGDSLRFVGYGPGATFVQIDATHWQINSGNGLVHEIITISNAASFHLTDYVFV